MAGILKVDQVQSDSNLAFAIAGSNVAFMNATSLQMVGSNVSLAGTNVFTSGKLVTAAQPVGTVLQVINTQSGAVATGTTVMVLDDTIPQITEGNEYMTLAITPTNASNKLLITVCAFLSHNQSGSWMLGALFQDSTANALAGFQNFQQTATGVSPVHLTHYMTAGTTSSTTFRFRAGAHQAGTTTFNGSNSARFFGGVVASSITIKEIAA
jgi:hypothetical protein